MCDGHHMSWPSASTDGVVGDVERRRLAEALVRLELRERPAGDALEPEHDLRAGAGKKCLTSIRLESIDVLLPQHERADRARPERQPRLGGVGRLGAGDGGFGARDRLAAAGQERQQVALAGQAGPAPAGGSSAIRPPGVVRSLMDSTLTRF